jgi:hypothetical protein
MSQRLSGKLLHEAYLQAEKEEYDKRPDIPHPPLPPWERMSAYSQKIYNRVAEILNQNSDAIANIESAFATLEKVEESYRKHFGEIPAITEK